MNIEKKVQGEARNFMHNLSKNKYMDQERISHIIEKMDIDSASNEIFFNIQDHYENTEIPSFIEFSDEDCLFDESDNIFEVLGVYRKQNDVPEGRIILFNKCIEKFGTKFYTNCTCAKIKVKPLSECIEMVYKIVFWHEFGHWLTHWMTDANNKKWGEDYWKISTDLSEGLAQLITFYAILNDKNAEDFKFLFEYMLIGQSDPYKKHIDIFRNINFSWGNAFKSIDDVRKKITPDLNDYLRILEYQN